MRKNACMPSLIPSPSSNGFHIGPLFFHFYGLCYVVGIIAAIVLTRRLWRERGGNVDLVHEVAIIGFPGGDHRRAALSRHHELERSAAQLVGLAGGMGRWPWDLGRDRRRCWRPASGCCVAAGVSVTLFMDAAAPGLLVAQAIGRVGNYFNQELFGGPTSLPWGLQISPAHRPGRYLHYATFQPTFLYELIWDLALAATLVWLIHHGRIRPPGIFALYVTGYSAFRIFEELLRVDPAHHILGERLNFWVASLLTLVGLVWFVCTQRPADQAQQAGLRSSADT